MSTEILTPAVGLLAGLCVVNLALLLVLSRRVTALLSGGRRPSSSGGDLIRGASVGAYETRSVTGDVVKSTDLYTADRTLVGFFSPTCGACHSQMPDFAELAGRWGSPESVLAVVAGDFDETYSFAGGLDGKAVLVADGNDGPIASAFRLQAFPGFAVVDSTGRIEAAAVTVADAVAQLRQEHVGAG